MRSLRILFSLTCMMLLSSKCFAVSQRIDGCENIDRVSNAIKTHLWPEWETINRDSLRRIFPVTLTEEEACEANPTENVKCVILNYKGRFTDSCDCCYSFLFDVVSLGKESYRDQLRSITIFHTETTFDSVIHTAQRLLSDIRAFEGGSYPDVTDWKLNSSNKITHMIRWETPLNEKSFIAKAVDLQIYQTKSGWTLYVAISREAVQLQKTASTETE